MSRTLPLGIDPALVGTEFDRSTSEPVTAAQIHEYARSLGETHPDFLAEDPIAPPTFCIRFRGSRFFHPSISRETFSRGFDAGKDIEFGVPIRPGDVISTRNVLHDVYEKTGRTGSMVFVVSRETMTNQRDEMVAIVDSRFMIRPKAEEP
jgi:acyl dehydratase